MPATTASCLSPSVVGSNARSWLHCTLSRNVGRSRVVRGPLPGHRQFADPPLEKVYLRPRQISHVLGCDREPSREGGSLMLSTSTANRMQTNCCVGCRTRQKEQKQQPAKRLNVAPHARSLLLAHLAAQSATGAAIEPKTSKNLYRFDISCKPA
jgi:hypothetical protein